MKNANGFGFSGSRLLGTSFMACALLMLIHPVSAAEDKPAIDPHADELLKRMGDYLAQAKFFSVEVEVWQDVEISSGQRVQAGRAIKVQVHRPNQLHMEVHSTRHNRELFFDGRALTLFNGAQKFYGTAQISGSLDQAMDAASERFGTTIPLEDFIRSDPYKDLLQKSTSGVDIGPVIVMGVSCERLAFTEDTIDWQVWIEDGPKPIPRKFVITYKDEVDSPQYTAIFSKWDFTTPLPDFVFKFEPPDGSSRIKVKEMRAENQAHHGKEK
jgi:hypothetical protein